MLNSSYKKSQNRKKAIIGGLGLLLLATTFFAINAGAMKLSLREIFLAFFNVGEASKIAIIKSIRLPRVLAGILAGSGFALSGLIMQNNLKNPLASPSTLGISNAAAFGANVAIIVFSAGSIANLGGGALSLSNPYLVTLCAMFFSLLATLAIIALARIGKFSPQSIVLAGVALNSLFSAGIMIIQYFSADPTKVAAVIFWTFGDLSRASWKEIIIMAVLIITAYIYFIIHRWDYNALSSGDDMAKSLGVNVDSLRLKSMFMASVITAVTVSFLGVIGFVGLISPQISKRIVGSDNRYLIPTSALMGSLILLLSDTLARVVLSPEVIPVGAITAFLGAPLFLYFLIKGENVRWA